MRRSIRRALQREESLRFSRGLKLGDGPSEMIQIRRKPFSSPLTPIRPRDKSRVSFMFQRDFQNQRAGPQENHEQVHERKDSYLVDKPSTAEKLQPEHGGLSHHRHFKDYELNSMPSGEQLSSSLSEGSGSWHSNMESSGLMFRKSPATDYIQKEIQDDNKLESE
uniref:Uncharacterized protein n=1 Tax=Gouania willdenowi TaxID=441366 RepID=A0A8C5D3S4_GOUWI